MTFEVLSILGGGNGGGGAEPPGQGGAEPPGQSGSAGSDGNGNVSETNGSNGASSGGTSSSGGTENTTAVQPTPVTAKAAKVELSGEKVSGGVTFEYPISGPDKFARAVAEQARVEVETEQLMAKIEETPEVADVGLDAEELRGPAEDEAVETKEADDKDNQGLAASDQADDPSAAKETSVFVETPDDGNE